MMRRDLARWCASLLMLSGALLSGACGGGGSESVIEPTYRHEGLSGRIVIRLRASGQRLLAATDRGVFERLDGQWTARGLETVRVQDIAIISDAHWIATVGVREGVPALHETVDGGRSWAQLAHDFGGAEGQERVFALAFDAPRERLLATGATVLASSTDFGRSWTRLFGEWQGFSQGMSALAVDPLSHDIWFGGQNAIEGFTLYRLRELPYRLDAYPGLLPSPSVALGLRFLSGAPARLAVAAEGGIAVTADDGGQWTTWLQDPSRFYFGLLQDPQRPERLVTAQWRKDFDAPQPFVLHVSDDDGRSWRSWQHPDPTLFGGVWSMFATVENQRSVYYFGLYRGGVLRLELDG